MSKHNLSAQEFAALLEWRMCSDPWPADNSTKTRIGKLLNNEAESRGYNSWVEAYHELH